MENQIINAIEGENLSVSGILFAESERDEEGIHGDESDEDGSEFSDEE